MKARILAWEAELRLFSKQYAKAEELLAANASRHTGCWLGAARLELGRQEQALKDLQAAVAACPEDNEARLWLAETRLRSGDTVEALRIFKQVQVVEPDKFWPLFGIAAALQAQDSVESLKYLRRAQKAWPELVAAAARGRLVGSRNAAKVILRIRELCGGFRRNEKYFLKLVLGKQTS